MKKFIFILLCLFSISSCSLAPSSRINSSSTETEKALSMLGELAKLGDELKTNPRFAELEKKSIAKTITPKEQQEMQLIADKRVDQFYAESWSNLDKDEKNSFEIIVINHSLCTKCKGISAMVDSVAKELGIGSHVVNASEFKTYLDKDLLYSKGNLLHNFDTNYWQLNVFSKPDELQDAAKKNFLPIFIRHTKSGLHTIGNIGNIYNREKLKQEILSYIINLNSLYGATNR
jgi:hypothetical protein